LGTVNALTVQPDGRILIGGAFSTVAGQTRKGVARLNVDGSLDTGFANPNAVPSVKTLVLQSDGRVLIGGGFSSVGGQQRSGVARLNGDGSLDPSFSNLNTSGSVSALAAQPDGRLFVSGSFNAIGGQTRSSLARISLSEAALQSLDVQGSTVTWRRSGTGPELASPPILYYSNYGPSGSYSVLGQMTRIAGGWQLTNVPAPVGRFYYLRVRGRTSGGSHNGSQGVIESVQRVWRDDRIYVDGFDQ